MSISSVASGSSWWNQQVAAMQALQSASGGSGTTGATSTTSTAGSNSTSSTSSTGTSGSSTQPTPFFVDFASDLQAMLAQITGSGTTSGGTTGTTQTADTNTADPTASTDPSTSTPGTQHRHHRGDDGSTQGDATQLVGSAVQTLQNTASGTADTAAAAGTFAGDVMQALQAYGGTAALATVTAAA